MDHNQLGSKQLPYDEVMLNMLMLHTKTYHLALAVFGIIFLASCAGVTPREQIALNEGLTLEEKVRELVSHGASRREVVATFGLPTGYTHDTLSYTVSNIGEIPTKLSYPLNSMYYPDPGYQGGDYRWVMSFDDRGSLYKYRRVPIDFETDGMRVYNYLKDEFGWEWAYWHGSYGAGFKALECTNTKHCWAVGGAGIVLETIDGGKSWAVDHYSNMRRYRQVPVISSFTSVSFSDPANGWSTGSETFPWNAIIMHSQDGGKNWSLQFKNRNKFFPLYLLHSIAFNDNRRGWAVGQRGTILHTTDGGSTWLAQSSGTKETLFSVGFCNGQSGWAVGSSRTILHTSDAGQNWSSQTISADQLPIKAPERHTSQLGEGRLTSLSVIDCSQGWIVGTHGLILHTKDSGENWQAQQSGTTESLNAVQFISAHEGWAVGSRGVILKTIDGGKQWKSQSSGTREDLRGLSFADVDHGWIGGSYGIILHTSDGGTTWTKQCISYACAGEAAEKFYWHPWLK